MESEHGNVDGAKVLEKFGKYQMLQYFFICVAVLIVTILNINYVFILGDVSYRCLVPECDTTPAEFSSPWWPTEIDHCSRPVLNQSWAQDNQSCAGAFTGAVERCDRWVYKNYDSVIASLNLACDPWRVNLVGTVHNVGLLFSMLGAGVLADKIGRKPTLILCTAGGAVGHLKAFASTYNTYIAVEFIEALLSGGVYPAAMVLMIEISNSKGRTLSGVLFAYAIYLGETTYATIAMFVTSWKNLLRIIYSPPFISIILYFLINESPRWLLLNGKKGQAQKTLKTIAKMNNIVTAVDITEQLLADLKVNKNEANEGFLEIVKSREIMKWLAVAGFSRFSVSLIYYGLMINSVFLPGNKYTNFMLASVMSFPGELIAMYLMNKFGRKIPLVVGFIICSGLCLSSGYVPDEYTTVKISLFLFGKMVIAVCFTGSEIYTMELFPTSTRGTLLGVCSLFSRIGSMIAPLTPILAIISKATPTLSFAFFALLTSLSLTLLPETKGRPLQDTIKEINELTKAEKMKKREDKLNKKYEKDGNEAIDDP